MLGLLFGLLFGVTVSWSLVPVPELNAPVVDLSNVITSNEKALIEADLRAFSASGKAQIQVLIIPTLDGETSEDFSMRVVEQWKLGDQKKDNGVLILVVTQDRKSRIEVGGGVEGDLTDISAKQILADQVRPFFQKSDFESGVKVAVAAVMNQLNGLAPEPKSLPGKKIKWTEILTFLVFMFLAFGGRRRMGAGRAFGAGALGGFMGGGGFGGGGSGWGSGGGSGGWSGGGGGFSGGGSSDSW